MLDAKSLFILQWLPQAIYLLDWIDFPDYVK